MEQANNHQDRYEDPEKDALQELVYVPVTFGESDDDSRGLIDIPSSNNLNDGTDGPHLVADFQKTEDSQNTGFFTGRALSASDGLPTCYRDGFDNDVTLSSNDNIFELSEKSEGLTDAFAELLMKWALSAIDGQELDNNISEEPTGGIGETSSSDDSIDTPSNNIDDGIVANSQYSEDRQNTELLGDSNAGLSTARASSACGGQETSSSDDGDPMSNNEQNSCALEEHTRSLLNACHEYLKNVALSTPRLSSIASNQVEECLRCPLPGCDNVITSLKTFLESAFGQNQVCWTDPMTTIERNSCALEEHTRSLLNACHGHLKKVALLTQWLASIASKQVEECLRCLRCPLPVCDNVITSLETFRESDFVQNQVCWKVPMSNNEQNSCALEEHTKSLLNACHGHLKNVALLTQWLASIASKQVEECLIFPRPGCDNLITTLKTFLESVFGQDQVCWKDSSNTHSERYGSKIVFFDVSKSTKVARALRPLLPKVKALIIVGETDAKRESLKLPVDFSLVVLKKVDETRQIIGTSCQYIAENIVPYWNEFRNSCFLKDSVYEDYTRFCKEKEVPVNNRVTFWQAMGTRFGVECFTLTGSGRASEFPNDLSRWEETFPFQQSDIGLYSLSNRNMKKIRRKTHKRRISSTSYRECIVYTLEVLGNEQEMNEGECGQSDKVSHSIAETQSDDEQDLTSEGEGFMSDEDPYSTEPESNLLKRKRMEYDESPSRKRWRLGHHELVK